jgi:hypothetical protein
VQACERSRDRYAGCADDLSHLRVRELDRSFSIAHEPQQEIEERPFMRPPGRHGQFGYERSLLRTHDLDQDDGKPRVGRHRTGHVVGVKLHQPCRRQGLRGDLARLPVEGRSLSEKRAGAHDLQHENGPALVIVSGLHCAFLDEVEIGRN